MRKSEIEVLEDDFRSTDPDYFFDDEPMPDPNVFLDNPYDGYEEYERRMIKTDPYIQRFMKYEQEREILSIEALDIDLIS